jgi:hypothetical protein
MRNAILGYATLAMCFTACAPRLVSRPGVAIQQLGVCINYDTTVPEEMRAGFERHLQLFIDEYNSESHRSICIPVKIRMIERYVSTFLIQKW